MCIRVCVYMCICGECVSLAETWTQVIAQIPNNVEVKHKILTVLLTWVMRYSTNWLPLSLLSLYDFRAASTAKNACWWLQSISSKVYSWDKAGRKLEQKKRMVINFMVQLLLSLCRELFHQVLRNNLDWIFNSLPLCLLCLRSLRCSLVFYCLYGLL